MGQVMQDLVVHREDLGFPLEGVAGPGSLSGTGRGRGGRVT